MYIEKKHWDILNEVGYVGSDLCQGKNDHGDSGNFFSLFLAPKTKYCLTINEYGVVQEHKTFKGFGDVNRLLDTKKYFEMKEGNKVSGKFPLSWKKSFETGVRFCNKLNSELCEDCENKIKQFKELEANLNELKRQKPNEFEQMLPYYIV